MFAAPPPWELGTRNLNTEATHTGGRVGGGSEPKLRPALTSPHSPDPLALRGQGGWATEALIQPLRAGRGLPQRLTSDRAFRRVSKWCPFPSPARIWPGLLEVKLAKAGAPPRPAPGGSTSQAALPEPPAMLGHRTGLPAPGWAPRSVPVSGGSDGTHQYGRHLDPETGPPCVPVQHPPVPFAKSGHTSAFQSQGACRPSCLRPVL